MSINYVQGVQDGGASRDSAGKIQHVRKLLFTFDEGESSAKILAQPQVPAHMAVHPEVTHLMCSGLRVEKSGERQGKATVHCTYSGDDSNYNPSLMPWEQPLYNWYCGPLENIVPFEQYYIDGDENKKAPLVTSSGTPIAAQTIEPHYIMRFNYNLRTFKDSWIVEYWNSINKDSITVAGIPIDPGAGILRLLDGNMISVYNDDGSPKYEYYKVSIEIEFNPKGWGRQFVDKSRWFIKDGKQTRIWTYVDKDGKPHFGDEYAMKKAAGATELKILGVVAHPAEEDQLLDGKGGIKYPDGLPVEDVPAISYAPFYEGKSTDAYDRKKKSWASLSLPRTRK